MATRNHSRRTRQSGRFGGNRPRTHPALQEMVGKLNDAIAVLGVVQRSLERQEIGSDEATILRQSIASLLAVHNGLEELAP